MRVSKLRTQTCARVAGPACDSPRGAPRRKTRGHAEWCCHPLCARTRRGVDAHAQTPHVRCVVAAYVSGRRRAGCRCSRGAPGSHHRGAHAQSHKHAGGLPHKRVRGRGEPSRTSFWTMGKRTKRLLSPASNSPSCLGPFLYSSICAGGGEGQKAVRTGRVDEESAAGGATGARSEPRGGPNGVPLWARGTWAGVRTLKSLTRDGSVTSTGRITVSVAILKVLCVGDSAGQTGGVL